jgi:hypothetical protein
METFSQISAKLISNKKVATIMGFPLLLSLSGKTIVIKGSKKTNDIKAPIVYVHRLNYYQ